MAGTGSAGPRGRSYGLEEIHVSDASTDRVPDGNAKTSPAAQGEMRRVLGHSLDRIRNAVEVLACRMLEQKLEKCPEIDKSRESIEDMYCLALNRVPSLYYHSTTSFAMRLEEQGPPSDILEALDKAIDYAILKVGQNPPSRYRD